MNRGGFNKEKVSVCVQRLFLICKGSIEHLKFNLVSLTTKQVETFFGELEYVAVQLKALGVLSTEDLRGLRIRKPPRLTKSPVFAG
jgi:hypothetical protein